MSHVKYDDGRSSMVDILYLRKENGIGNDRNSFEWIILQKMLFSVIKGTSKSIAQDKAISKPSHDENDKENSGPFRDHNSIQNSHSSTSLSPMKPLDFSNSNSILSSPTPNLAMNINNLIKTPTIANGKECNTRVNSSMNSKINKGGSKFTRNTSVFISTPEFSDI